MADYDASTYGERIAEVYDQLYPSPANVDAVADFLAQIAGSGRALELGIGTGRIAIPLAARGVRLFGIDTSPAMVTKLQAKPGGENIPVTIGDFAEVKVPGKFSLIYVVFNTLFALRTQEEQIRCFARVAKHLKADAAFVVEAFFPDMTYFVRGQRLETLQVGTDFVYIDAVRLEATSQLMRLQHITLSEKGIRMYPVEMRFVWPAEMDLMARLAGLRLRQRFGGWQREPFTATSVTHVSVYELAPPPRGSR